MSFRKNVVQFTPMSPTRVEADIPGFEKPVEMHSLTPDDRFGSAVHFQDDGTHNLFMFVLSEDGSNTTIYKLHNAKETDLPDFRKNIRANPDDAEVVAVLYLGDSFELDIRPSRDSEVTKLTFSHTNQ